MTDKVVSVTFRVDPATRDEMDVFVAKHGFGSRSEFLREAIAWAIAHPEGSQ